MYINFTNRYKKIFWLLLGFILSCIYVHKVSAYNYYGLEIDQQFLNTLWSKIEGKTPRDLDFSSFNSDYIYHQSDYPYVSCSRHSSYTYIYSCDFFKNIDLYSTINTNTKSFGIYFQNKTDNIVIEYLTNNNTISTSAHTQIETGNNEFRNYYWANVYTANSSYYYQNYSVTNFTITNRITKSFDYTPQNIPDYLQGYTEITLEPGERYVIFSSSTISSGSVYIPISDFNDYGSRISYFDKDIDTQPYTSYIQDFSTTPDGLYAKQNFDLSTYTGSDFIMFSKYIYLEGPDDFSSSVWVPSEMYSSVVQVTPNNTGGNDFDYSYVDTNGELQASIISSSDLSQGSPLVSDLFTNFTTKDYGLSSIITAPIPLLQSLNNSSCSTIELPLGMFGGVHDHKLVLPCMTPIYSSMFGQFFTLYQTITTGFIAYYVGLAYFNKIKQLKDPDNDSIEVVDL